MPVERIPDDYVPESQQFEQFKPGKYTINGLKFFTLDDEDNPIFVAQSGDRLVARFRTILAKDGEEGPPGSVDRGQLPLLVRAFGIDPKELPPFDQPTQRLIMAERLINEGSKKIAVIVGDGGWIRSISGMSIPQGYYRLKYRRTATLNEFGEPSWIEGTYGKFAVVVMEIVGDAVGNPCPYDRVRLREYLSYPLVVNEGKLGWEVTDKGAPTGAAVVFSSFAFAVCGDDLFSRDFENLENIMPEVHDCALEMGRICLGTAELNRRNRMCLRLGSLVPVGDGEGRGIPPEGIDTGEEAAEEVSLQDLYDTLDESFGGRAFSEGWELTEEAKTWWRSFEGADPTDGEPIKGIGAFVKKHSIPNIFAKMTPQHISLILGWMSRQILNR